VSEVDGGAKSKSGSKKKGGKLLEYLQEEGKLDDEEDDGDFSEEHEKYKLRYYREKFELEDDDKYSCLNIFFSLFVYEGTETPCKLRSKLQLMEFLVLISRTILNELMS
jgi:hypothetical protein